VCYNLILYNFLFLRFQVTIFFLDLQYVWMSLLRIFVIKIDATLNKTDRAQSFTIITYKYLWLYSVTRIVWLRIIYLQDSELHTHYVFQVFVVSDLSALLNGFAILGDTIQIFEQETWSPKYFLRVLKWITQNSFWL